MTYNAAFSLGFEVPNLEDPEKPTEDQLYLALQARLEKLRAEDGLREACDAPFDVYEEESDDR